MTRFSHPVDMDYCNKKHIGGDKIIWILHWKIK